ncbi:TPA: hypothetical protein DEP94_03380 [Candidatus Nomurabacteria bacterium]|nr:hypothetical protein [Candidatus Nomurabacteria bacterium]
MKEIIELIKKFRKFSEKEIDSAVKELGNIKEEKNRKHLQRLVYTNLVNRFDVLLDNLLLIYGTKDSGDFKNVVLEKVKDTNITLKDFYQILLSEDSKVVATEKVEDLIRLNFLRERHSKKLRTLLEVCLQVESSELNRPRVNANDGRIHTSYTPRGNNVPPSIIGYADYLYSKRNGLVHGDGALVVLSSDAKYLEKIFKTKSAKFIGIKLSSIESASQFYTHLCDFIEFGKWPQARGFK